MCSTPTLILILSYVIIRIIMFRELQNTSMLVHQVQTEPKTVHLSKIVDVFYTTVNFLDRSTQTSQVVGPPCNLLPFFLSSTYYCLNQMVVIQGDSLKI